MGFLKKFCQNNSESLKRLHFFFFCGLASTMGRHVQKDGSKFQDSSKEAHEERPKRVCYRRWPWGPIEGVVFLLKSNPISYPSDIPWASGSAPNQCPTTMGTL